MIASGSGWACGSSQSAWNSSSTQETPSADVGPVVSSPVRARLLSLGLLGVASLVPDSTTLLEVPLLTNAAIGDQVIDVTADGFRLVELAPGIDFEFVQARTGCELLATS